MLVFVTGIKDYVFDAFDLYAFTNSPYFFFVRYTLSPPVRVMLSPSYSVMQSMFTMVPSRFSLWSRSRRYWTSAGMRRSYC